MYPAECLTIPVYGESDITKNFKRLKQDGCKDLQVHQILETDGKIKNARFMPEGKEPLEMELRALRIETEDKRDKLRVKAFDIEGELTI